MAASGHFFGQPAPDRTPGAGVMLRFPGRIAQEAGGTAAGELCYQQWVRLSRLRTGARCAAFTLFVWVGGCQAFLDFNDPDAAGQADASSLDATLTDGSSADVTAMDGISLEDGGLPADGDGGLFADGATLDAADSAADGATTRADASDAAADGGTKKIYVRTPNTRGDFNSIIAADQICNLNINRPSGVAMAKALLVGPSRTACTTPYCTNDGLLEHNDWPLTPNTTYLREDGEVVGVTDANGLFATPLKKAIAPDGGVVWTGLRKVSTDGTDWTTSDTHCTDWTDTTGQGANGSLGYANLTSGAFAGNATSCFVNEAIYCVQIAP